VNQPDVEAKLRDLDPALLSGLAEHALKRSTESVLDWHYERISIGRGPATLGLYRVAGRARCGMGTIPWSVILKVLAPSSAETMDPGHPLYWRREGLVYGSGWLDELPSQLRAPRCYAIAEQSENSCWLWLEDVQDRCRRLAA
jgi:hypothetical protein